MVFGATVELEDQGSGEVVKYQIVGDDEADIKAGWVSVSSPIARALIGKSEGDMRLLLRGSRERGIQSIGLIYVVLDAGGVATVSDATP